MELTLNTVFKLKPRNSLPALAERHEKRQRQYHAHNLSPSSLCTPHTPEEERRVQGLLLRAVPENRLFIAVDLNRRRRKKGAKRH